MAESIFGAAWWPIHVAVAWVLTRDRAFVERSSRAGKSLRSIAVALATDKVDGKPTERYFKDSTDGWYALREGMAAGNVRASGTPFRRVADLEGGAVVTDEMAREIPAVEIGTLRLQDDGNDKDCLVPEDWRVAHGSNRNNLRGYRNVQVFRDDVLHAFKDDGAAASVATVAAETAAINALASHLKTNEQLTRRDAAEWCCKQGFNLSYRGFQNRVWPTARTNAGLESKAAPGRKRKSSR